MVTQTYAVNITLQSSEARGVAEFVNRNCQRIDRLQLLHHSRVYTSVRPRARAVRKTTHAINMLLPSCASVVTVHRFTDCRVHRASARTLKKPHTVNITLQSSEARGVAEFVNRDCQRIDRLQLLHHSRVYTSVRPRARAVRKTAHAINIVLLSRASVVTVHRFTDCRVPRASARTLKKTHTVNVRLQSSEARGVAEFVNRDCQRIDRLFAIASSPPCLHFCQSSDTCCPQNHACHQHRSAVMRVSRDCPQVHRLQSAPSSGTHGHENPCRQRNTAKLRS